MAGKEADSLPDTWRVARLGDVMRLGYGVALPERDRRPGWVPVYGSAGRVGWHDEAEVRGPGIVVGRKGSIGNVNWVPGDFVPIDTTYFAGPLDGQADLRWLFHTLLREDLSTLNRATGVPGLNRDDVYALRRPVPPLPEQRAIAAVLDSIGEVIERTEEVIAATERLRDALLHQLLTRGLPGRHTAWRDIPGLGTIPACWEVVSLGDVAEVDRGVSWAREQESSVALTSTTPVVRIGNVQREGFRMEDTLHIRGVPETDRVRRSVKPGTLVMVGSNGNPDRVGNVFLANDQVIGHLLASFLIGIVPGREFSETFLAETLRSRPVQSRITESTAGSTGLKNLSLRWLRRLDLGLPSPYEQRAIAASLDCVDNTLERAREEQAALRSWRASAADALLTGRVRIDAERESRRVSARRTGRHDP